jgi:hypothetical protein
MKVKTLTKFPLPLMLLISTSLVYLFILQKELQLLLSKPRDESTVSKLHVTSSKSLSLYPGELPGYTGWPRQATTLAGSFEIVRPCTLKSIVGTNWTCSAHCSHEACHQGGSLFYLRAYGPAILPGLVTDHRNGTYDFTFLPLDEGGYTVEVVLTFSHPPPLSAFPLEKSTEPAVYEGYMLPGFPLFLSAGRSYSSANSAVSLSDEPLPVCTKSDILESGPYSAVENGRWVVKEKMIERSFSLSNHANTNVSLDGYQRGTNSLGIHMEYRPTKCSLLDEATLKDGQTLAKWMQRNQGSHQGVTQKPKPKRRLGIVLAGDSNMMMQAQLFYRESFLGLALIPSYLNTHYGINNAGVIAFIKESVSSLLERDAQQDIPTSYVIVLNSGLHDIMQLCGSDHFGLKIDFEARGDARCADTYRSRLKEFAQELQKLPSVLTFFQTSTAAWPKYGVYGAAWLPNVTQALPFTSDFAHYFNEIAWDVMGELDIPVMDTYWMTYSRPDHRESTDTNTLAGKMAHAGPEVYDVLVRQWVMMILETLCASPYQWVI